MQKKFLWFAGLICLAFLTYLILANATITIQVPTIRSNWTTNISVNVSYNLTSIAWNSTTTNMTVYINMTGDVWIPLSPANVTCANNSVGTGVTNFSCNGTFNISVSFNSTTIPDGFYGVNVTIYNSSSTARLFGPLVAGMPARVAIDHSPPVITFLSLPAGTSGMLRANANLSGLGVILNVTVNDTISGVGSVYFNITNFSGGTNFNQTAFLYASKTTGNNYNYSSLNTTQNQTSRGFTDGKYNVTIYANQTNTSTSGGSGATVVLLTYPALANNTERVQIIIDNSIPVVEAANFTKNEILNLVEIQAGGNYSGRININISLNDTQSGGQESGIDSVYFNITNISTKGQVAFLKASRSTGALWNYSFLNVTENSSIFLDGKYNVSVFANDTAGNNNGTATTNAARIQIAIDNTAPTLAYTCDTTTPSAGETMTCSCSGTNNSLTLVNTSSLSYSTSPATGESGTFTVTCVGKNYAGTQGSASLTYTVESGYSLPGGGGAGGGAGAVSTGQKVQSWTKITPGEATIMKNFDVAYGVKQISVTVSNEAQNVQITVNKYDSKPAAVETAKTGDVYKYLQIKPQNLAGKLDKATITIQVAKSWTTEKQLEKEQVALFKYDETAKTWNELTTTFKEEDLANYYYDADLTSFSYFAIGEKAVAAGEEEEEISPGAAAVKGLLGNIWFWVIAVAIIIAIIAYFALKKK